MTFVTCLTNKSITLAGGLREQINSITAFLDAGAVYGSTSQRADQLRSFSEGQLNISADGLPYEKPGTKCNIPETSTDHQCFAAGEFYSPGMNLRISSSEPS